MTRNVPRGRRTWLSIGLVTCLGAAVWVWYASRLQPVDVPVVAPHADAPATVRFADVTDSSGITFVHDAAAEGKRWYPETIGSGVAFFDYDGDAWPDILFVNSPAWPRTLSAGSRSTGTGLSLYRNRGDGTFEEVTQRAGLAVPLYGMGVAVADYDNDGDRDILVTGYLRHLFFINNGDGTFAEATQKVGIRGGTWGVGAAFFDYDRDGWLDLVLSSYVEWRPELERDLDCSYGTPDKDYCPVRYFKGQGLALYHNEGDGTFRDVTQQAGVASEGTRAFAPAILDYDEDGWPDMFVASDGTPSLLWRNRGDGTFENVGVRTGVVLDEGGAAYAGMGIDVAYPHNDNQLCVAIGNFVGEPTTLHCRMPQGDDFSPALYAEMSAQMGVGRETLRSVTFGLFFFDADLDGWQDLFMVNGHVVDEAHLRHVPRAQTPQLFHNLGTGRFEDVSAQAGLTRALIGRGAAHADYDGDGDLDLVLSQNQGPAVLLRNDAPRRAHFLKIRLTGTRSNRDGIGADVRVHMAETMLRQTVRTGVSYLSQSAAPLIFGLGETGRVTRVEVVWPSGTVDRLEAVAADTTLHIVEGQYRVDVSPLTARRADEPVTPPAPDQDPYLAYVHDGVVAYRDGDYVQAATAFEKALPLRPDEPVPYRYLADLYWRRGKRDQAVQILHKLAQVMPDAYFLDRQGSGYEDDGLPGLAQHIYAEAVRIDPQFPSARFNLGRMYLKRGDTERGIAEVEAALNLYPDFAEAHETLGLAYTEKGDWATAMSHLQRALELDPDLAVGHNHLGRIYMAQGRFSEAVATFQDLVAQHPNAPEARHNLAVAYARSGNREQALAAFRTALHLQPDLYAARLDLAALALEMGRPQDAIDALVPMREMPVGGDREQASYDVVEVHYRLGLAYVMAQRLAEAIRELGRVVHLQPDHAAAHLYLGSLYYRQREFERAWHHAREAERLGAAVTELLAALHRAAPAGK